MLPIPDAFDIAHFCALVFIGACIAGATVISIYYLCRIGR